MIAALWLLACAPSPAPVDPAHPCDAYAAEARRLHPPAEAEALAARFVAVRDALGSLLAPPAAGAGGWRA